MGELEKRDEIILKQEEKAKRYFRFNIYQMNEEGCLKYIMAELEKENQILD